MTSHDTTSTPTKPRSALRGDIQGLRAVAVLVVVVGHAGLGLSGGFVGVDVFFVISGFLISQLLFREVDRTGGVSLSRFYARRARRILPAATLVTLVTLVASLLWISKIQAQQVAYDALWATFFAANIRFGAQEVDYFAQDQPASPMQHYWSLSVEEQFYLVWPLLLLVVVLLARRRGSVAQGLPRTVVAAVLAMVTAASLAWSVLHTDRDPQGAYFGTLDRVWELGLGALLALMAPLLLRRATMRLRGLLCAAGLAAIAVACVTFDDHTAMPGYAALLPVLGSAMVLLSGTATDRQPDGEAALPNRLLAVAPMQRIGDWSYSLYLWHWPLLLIPALAVGHELPLGVNLMLVALAIALSAATYRWVETPFRTSTRMTTPRSIALYPAALAMVAGATVAGTTYVAWAVSERGDDPPVTLRSFGVEDEASYDLPRDRRAALVAASVIAARHHMALPSDLTPDLIDLLSDLPDVGACEYWEEDVRELCPRGDPDGARTLVVLGDSHGRMWIPALEQVAQESGYTTYYLVRPHCNPGRMQVGHPDTGEPFLACTEFNAWVLEQVARIAPDLAIVASSPPSRYGGLYVDGEHEVGQAEVEAATRTGFTSLFTDLQMYADRTVLIADVPAQLGYPAPCLSTGEPDLGTCAFTPLQRSQRIRKATVEAAHRTGVEVVDMNRWICWDGTCPAVVGSTITYRDRDHLTQTYAAELAPQLGRELGLSR